MYICIYIYTYHNNTAIHLEDPSSMHGLRIYAGHRSPTLSSFSSLVCLVFFFFFWPSESELERFLPLLPELFRPILSIASPSALLPASTSARAVMEFSFSRSKLSGRIQAAQENAVSIAHVNKCIACNHDPACHRALPKDAVKTPVRIVPVRLVGVRDSFLSPLDVGQHLSTGRCSAVEPLQLIPRQLDGLIRLRLLTAPQMHACMTCLQLLGLDRAWTVVCSISK